jgi:microcompartment protein CcmL/EutN
MVFESLGTFETCSLSAAIKALEEIQKEKFVNILGKQILGDGIVTLFVSGELGAIKRALEAGAAEINSTNEFRSLHIIPLPHKDLHNIIGFKRN